MRHNHQTWPLHFCYQLEKASSFSSSLIVFSSFVYPFSISFQRRSILEQIIFIDPKFLWRIFSKACLAVEATNLDDLNGIGCLHYLLLNEKFLLVAIRENFDWHCCSSFFKFVTWFRNLLLRTLKPQPSGSSNTDPNVNVNLMTNSSL